MFPISAGWSNPYQYWLILAICYIILFLSFYCVTLCVKHYKTHCLLLKSNCLLLMSIWSLMFIGEKHQCLIMFPYFPAWPPGFPSKFWSSSCSTVKLSHFHDFHGWKKKSSCFTSHVQNVVFSSPPPFFQRLNSVDLPWLCGFARRKKPPRGFPRSSETDSWAGSSNFSSSLGCDRWWNRCVLSTYL